jgi:UDP-N-acetylmuramyl pentapeptide phosphotransferase/UDP-N-acetylglucosamine-1-phosphate transferase
VTEPGRPQLPRAGGIAVLVGVVVLILIVLVLAQIPHAQRPTLNPSPQVTTITLSTSP